MSMHTIIWNWEFMSMHTMICGKFMPPAILTCNFFLLPQSSNIIGGGQAHMYAPLGPMLIRRRYCPNAEQRSPPQKFQNCRIQYGQEVWLFKSLHKYFICKMKAYCVCHVQIGRGKSAKKTKHATYFSRHKTVQILLVVLVTERITNFSRKKLCPVCYGNCELKFFESDKTHFLRLSCSLGP